MTIHRIPEVLSLAAFVGVLLLIPLYLSQRRDVLRLRSLRENSPDHPVKDIAASEVLLDRAELELEQILTETGQFTAVGPREPSTDPGRLTPLPPGERVATGPVTGVSRPVTHTGERPALEQLTMEREALLPHPRWRHFAARVTQPRVLAVVGLAAVALGVAGLFASGQILGGGNEVGSKPERAGALAPADISVAVLNATSTPGLAGHVGDDVDHSGFKLDAVGDSRKQFSQSVVMFSPGQKKAAQKVAHVLGITPVQPIDSDTRAQAPDADVVVIAGSDRAKP